MNIVFIGHVDAGKSTISGHIMYLTGQVDDRTLAKFESEAKAKNRESWKYAWAMDTTDQERAKGKTEECGRGTFETENRFYTILDAPGHKNFVPHMIDGASQADVAVLVISARKGEFETGFERGGQTQEHAVLAKTVGVKTIIVVINKMDDPTVEWAQSRYDECVDKLTPFLKKTGFNTKTDVIFLPVSGLGGVNIKDPLTAETCAWYSGPSLIQVLDGVKPPERLGGQPMRFTIHEKYRDMGTIVMGKIEAGSIKRGDSVTVMPNKVPVEVTSVALEGAEVSVGQPGDNVRLRLRGVEEEDLRVGMVICDSQKVIQGCRWFDAKISILEYKSIICPGYKSVLHIHAACGECTITALRAILDRKGKVVQKKPQFVKEGQMILARVRVENPVCIERFADFPALGRFMLRDEGKTIAIGVIQELFFPKQKTAEAAAQQ